jgi:hypothetical protein
MAAPSAERLSTRHLVLDPSPQIYAGSSTSARGCFRLSSMSKPIKGFVQIARSLLDKSYKPRKLYCDLHMPT